MSDSLIDDNTRAAVIQAHDQVASMLAHFSRPDATWDSFGKVDLYLDRLQVGLENLAFYTAREIARRNPIEPVDLGT